MSIALYAATMLWLFSYDRLRLRLSRFILSASAYTLGFEMVLIMLQGARGAHAFQQCHALGSTLFQLMAVTITFF